MHDDEIQTVLYLFTKENILPSIRSQCPVRTQKQTKTNDRKKDINSAAVNLPHSPNEILKSYKVKLVSL